MKFKTDPFYLFPIRENMIDTLFVDREEEIKVVKGILNTSYENTKEICAVIGGIGVGKSSILQYIIRLAAKKKFHVNFFHSPDDFYSKSSINNKKRTVNIIDDVDKLDDKNSKKFYLELEEGTSQNGSITFFID